MDGVKHQKSAGISDASFSKYCCITAGMQNVCRIRCMRKYCCRNSY